MKIQVISTHKFPLPANGEWCRIAARKLPSEQGKRRRHTSASNPSWLMSNLCWIEILHVFYLREGRGSDLRPHSALTAAGHWLHLLGGSFASVISLGHIWGRKGCCCFSLIPAHGRLVIAELVWVLNKSLPPSVISFISESHFLWKNNFLTSFISFWFICY